MFSLLSASGLFFAHFMLFKGTKDRVFVRVLISNIHYFGMFVLSIVFNLFSNAVFAVLLLASLLSTITVFIDSNPTTVHNEAKENLRGWRFSRFIPFTIATVFSVSVWGPVFYLLVQFMPGNMARTLPGFPADIVYAVVVCFLTYFLVGPVLSFLQSFRTKLLSFPFFGLVALSAAIPMFLFLVFCNIYSDSSPLRVTLHHEQITATNESRIALSWPHPASIGDLEEELSSIGYEPFACRTNMPFLMDAVCVNVEPIEVLSPEIVIERASYNEESQEYNYTITVSSAEPERLGFVFPSSLKLWFDGYLVDNMLGVNAFTLNIGDGVEKLKYAFTIGNVEEDFEITILETSYRHSPGLFELVDKLHPRIIPWGKSYLPGEVVTIEKVLIQK
ncbi:hypothetical protein GEMRC1_011699 [Eukaryota sp. GEM-RC1]